MTPTKATKTETETAKPMATAAKSVEPRWPVIKVSSVAPPTMATLEIQTGSESLIIAQ